MAQPSRSNALTARIVPYCNDYYFKFNIHVIILYMRVYWALGKNPNISWWESHLCNVTYEICMEWNKCHMLVQNQIGIYNFSTWCSWHAFIAPVTQPRMRMCLHCMNMKCHFGSNNVSHHSLHIHTLYISYFVWQIHVQHVQIIWLERIHKWGVQQRMVNNYSDKFQTII